MYAGMPFISRRLLNLTYNSLLNGPTGLVVKALVKIVRDGMGSCPTWFQFSQQVRCLDNKINLFL